MPMHRLNLLKKAYYQLKGPANLYADGTDILVEQIPDATKLETCGKP